MIKDQIPLQIKKDIFFHIFIYELEILLKDHTKEILKISFQSDEANTDRPLKEFLKSFIMKNLTSIPSQKYTNSIIISLVDEENKVKEDLFYYKDFADIIISNILLQEEINDYHKKLISDLKSTVYTNPDLFFYTNR